MRSHTTVAPCPSTTPIFGVADLLALLALEGSPPTGLFLRFEVLVRLPERTRSTRASSVTPSLGVFVAWKFESIRQGVADQLVVLDEWQGRGLMQACRQEGLRIVDNTELRAAG